MIVAVTGSQRGASVSQLVALGKVLLDVGATELRHGDCVGADQQAHDVAVAIGLAIVIHPPANEARRAFCVGAREVLPPRPYLDRNHEMVLASDMLVALPAGDQEVLRSGTWATVRFARTWLGPAGVRVLSR